MTTPQTFTLKQLRFTFTLASNASFPGTNSNVLTVTGLRASANLRLMGLPAFSEADITVYGLLQADMLALTALAFQPQGTNRNTVMVEANGGQGWSTAFLGQIITAGPEYTESPAASLRILARTLGYESLAPITPTSYTGPTSVATIVQNLAEQLGYTFENNGVTTTLNNPYFSGTLADQLRAIKQQAGIQVFIEGKVIAICPPGVARVQPAFVLTPSSGLVGYPKLDYQRGFINAQAIYNPSLRFGGPVTIQDSVVKNANGSWVIGTLSHSLESLSLSGAWFSDMLLYPPSLGIPALQ